MTFMHTQWVFRGYSHSLIDVPVHSMGVQGLFYSLIGVHMHSQVFRRCSICVQPIYLPEGPNEYVFKFAKLAIGPITLKSKINVQFVRIQVSINN